VYPYLCKKYFNFTNCNFQLVLLKCPTPARRIVRIGLLPAARHSQGDQIGAGRIFAYCAKFFLWALFFKNQKVRKFMDYFFPKVSVLYFFWQKTGWAAFWRLLHNLIWSPWLHSTHFRSLYFCNLRTSSFSIMKSSVLSLMILASFVKYPKTIAQP
jgi:hypothetical protein